MGIENLEIRVAVSADIVSLAGMNHSCTSEYVWQLDLDKQTSEYNIALREVRLTRSVQVEYPRDHLLLADVWKDSAITFVAINAGVPIGYIRFLEQEAAESI